MIYTVNLGYPRIGKKRELKFALEKYWRGDTDIEHLRATAKNIKENNWKLQKAMGIDFIPSGDFSLYDHVLDHAFMFGAIPERFSHSQVDIPEDLYFSMARGFQKDNGDAIPAMEMTKWFNTNYHYIVPEIEPNTSFTLNAEKLFTEIDHAVTLGIQTRPVLLGPVSFLLLSKSNRENYFPVSKLDELLPIYGKLLALLKEKGIEWVQMDEPFLATDLSALEISAYKKMFATLSNSDLRPKIVLTAYFADISLNINLLTQSPFEGIHIDLSQTENEENIISQIGNKEVLSLGIINGRNIWRENIKNAISRFEKIAALTTSKKLLIAPSCSLRHLPIDVNMEDGLNPDIKSWLAFANQKLEFLSVLKSAVIGENKAKGYIARNQEAIESQNNSSLVRTLSNTHTLDMLSPETFTRLSAFPIRKAIQKSTLGLPDLPTTTIGSFPQTRAVRKARSDLRKGLIDDEAYKAFIKEEIANTVKFQEAAGIDVLVHGEFERNDMVQYFAEKLSGFAFTKHGWVQSYGSRYVRPPIIYGDVSRPEPMTVAWATYAQSLSQKHVKGMLTGPVTILQWSFVRDDQPRSETCMQIAFAIREEVADLESAGIRIIQIDEPALREGLPIQRSTWNNYLSWAVKCFRIASSGVKDETQIHTHMCYAEFNDILNAIVEMDADVISIEASRSKMELLDTFGHRQYPNEIGPGIYDIHSPNIPSQAEIEALLIKALEVIPPDQLWVNPDCGLKTRRWDEVKPALKNMVAAAMTLREKEGKKI